MPLSFFNSVTGNSAQSFQKFAMVSYDINPPTALSVLSSDLSSVVVSFTPPTTTATITGYKAYANGQLVNSYGTASSLTINGLTSATSYNFNIVASITGGGLVGLSNASSQISGTTLSTIPTNLTILSYTASSVTISFTPPGGIVTGYNTYSNGLLVSGSGVPSSYTISGLSSNSSFSITLTGLSSAGESAASSALTGYTIPSAPTSLTFISTDTTSVTFSFTAPTGNGTITSYTPYVNGIAGTGSGTPSSYTITGLASSNSYTITLSATNSSGTSGQSTGVSMSTSPYIYTGGTLSSNGTVRTITYTTASAPDSGSVYVGSFTANVQLTSVNMCIVSGGGGAGLAYIAPSITPNIPTGGGGGGGGMVLVYETANSKAATIAAGTTFNVYVGTGGSSVVVDATTGVILNNTLPKGGSNSYLSITSGSITSAGSALPTTITATNSGYAGRYGTDTSGVALTPLSTGNNSLYPPSGAGAGGGGGSAGVFNTSATPYAGGLSNGSGGNGGAAYGDGAHYYANCGGGGGGGGPSGTAGGLGSPTGTAGNGGTGTRFVANNTYYGGGGGGGANSGTYTSGSGGTGGGGAGSTFPNVPNNGTANTGGGGGGGSLNKTAGAYRSGATGANGTVILIFTY